MRHGLFLVMLVLLAPPAFAHGDGLPISPSELWHHWNFDPLVWGPLVLSHWLYGRGVMRAWARAGQGRVMPIWRAACFVAGEIVVVTALISPLDPLGETLLSAHMAQHILLTAIAPALLVLGLPVRAWTWAMPRTWRRAGADPAVRVLSRAFGKIASPFTATTLGVLVMWSWHAPVLFEAALENKSIHTIEHLAFFLSSLLVWRAALSPGASAMAAALSTVTVFMAGGMLGGLLSLAPAPLYDWYGNRSLLWGLLPIEDQQLAGLLMWVVAGGIYLAAFVAFALSVVSAPRSRPSTGIMRASTSSRSTK